MKLLVIFAASIALCAGYPQLGVPGDNSHYVEGESQYIWIPDGEGVPHIVDLWDHQTDEIGDEMTRNGANNAYWLFTRENPTARQIIINGNADSIWASNYNRNRPLKVIVHGWQSDGSSDINRVLAAAFLHIMDCNVIVLDWRRAASGLTYITSANRVPDVGVHLGNFLTWLINTAGGDFNQVHLVGFSLGAHVVGNAGRTVGGRVARITGLDPAGPIFGGNSKALKADDAQYVECIHTDGGALGIFDPIGLINFYPNGGRSQPGCWVNSCSHSRAYKFFEASLYYDHFPARSCATLSEARNKNCTGHVWIHMGNSQIDKRGEGIFGVATSRNWPYGL